MAISLASGVLVSTLLTLVVIPLGCVAAADSLCAVAGTQCRKFSRGQEPDGGPDGPGGGGGTGRRRAGDPLWVKAWGGFASVLFTTIGAVVALVRMTAGLFRRGPRTARPPSAETAAARQGGANVSVQKEKVVRPAANSTTGARRVSATERARVRRADASAERPPSKATDSRKRKPTPAAKDTPRPVAASRPVTQDVASVAKTAAQAAATVPAKTVARKAVAKKAAPRKEEPQKAQTAPAEKKTASSTNQPSPAIRPKVAGNRKKASGRRGIQLKTLGKTGGDGLN